MTESKTQNINFKLTRYLKDTFKRLCKGSDQTSVMIKLMSIYIEFTKERRSNNAINFMEKYYRLTEVTKEEYEDYKKKILSYKKVKVIKKNPFNISG